MRKTWAPVVFYFYLSGAAVLIEVTGVDRYQGGDTAR